MSILKSGLLASIAVAAVVALSPTTASAHGWGYGHKHYGYRHHGYYKVWRPYSYHYYTPRYYSYGYKHYRKW